MSMRCLNDILKGGARLSTPFHLTVIFNRRNVSFVVAQLAADKDKAGIERRPQHLSKATQRGAT
jgi:hypothetical protein